MRHNRRPRIPTTDIAPNRLSLRRGELIQVACPFCDRWRLVERGMLRPHRRGDGTQRCPGSGQRVRVNETEEQWRLRLADALVEARRSAIHWR